MDTLLEGNIFAWTFSKVTEILLHPVTLKLVVFGHCLSSNQSIKLNLLYYNKVTSYL